MWDDLGIKLKMLREHEGWTQFDLSEKLGVCKDAVKFWEMGRNTPSIRNRKKIRDLLEKAGIR